MQQALANEASSNAMSGQKHLRFARSLPTTQASEFDSHSQLKNICSVVFWLIENLESEASATILAVETSESAIGKSESISDHTNDTSHKQLTLKGHHWLMVICSEVV
jgi:hypothetical protein